ncbi:hypothetical protein [Pontibacter beigongshangensis]|uniref:hypothetical protein n=1 Tax=Pontibacter beigongshangensis TaxID=2574733 RepID=UPI00164F0156|nr:hypothetical protein [Pontibacter beigongshangensis]
MDSWRAVCILEPYGKCYNLSKFCMKGQMTGERIVADRSVVIKAALAENSAGFGENLWLTRANDEGSFMRYGCILCASRAADIHCCGLKQELFESIVTSGGKTSVVAPPLKLMCSPETDSSLQ